MYSFPFGLREVNESRYEFGPNFFVLRDTEPPFGAATSLVNGSLNSRLMHNRASALAKEGLAGLQIKVEALLLQSETCNETSWGDARMSGELTPPRKLERDCVSRPDSQVEIVDKTRCTPHFGDPPLGHVLLIGDVVTKNLPANIDDLENH